VVGTVKKYVVRLSAEERVQLDELIRKGRRSAQLLTKARILLKADVSELGEGWSDSRIAAALDTSIATIERTRRQLVEEGFEAVLRRKYNPNSARPRIFDGVAEAKLIALTLSLRPRRVSPVGACACSRRRSSTCTLSSAPATTRSGGR
jgi:Homeodomain-like domain